MPQAPSKAYDLDGEVIHEKIGLLINNLVNIKDESGKFLLRLPDGRVIDTKGWNDWEWTHGIGLYGLYQYYSLTGRAEPLSIIDDWFKKQLAAGTTKNINTMAVFLTLAYRYEDLGRPKSYVPWLEGWADWAMYDLARTPYGGMQHTTYAGPNHHELWDDTLMMTVMPLAKIGLVLNRPAYVEEAKRQFLLHIRYLWDPTTGLFFHGWKFDEDAPGGVGHNFARARWARGNSWVTIVIPEFIELLDLQPNDPIRRDLIDVLLAQCKALKRLQNPDGLWRTLLDEPENEGSYVEASASAGFAYGMLKAMRKRYIAKEEFEDCAIQGIKAVIKKISPEGELLNTSFGTGMGNSLQHYKDIAITSMPYGQSMAIMALVEFLQVWMWRMDEPFWKDPSLALAEKR